MLQQTHLFLSEARNPSFSRLHLLLHRVCQLAFFVSGDFIAHYVARMYRNVLGQGLRLMFSLSINLSVSFSTKQLLVWSRKCRSLTPKAQGTSLNVAFCPQSKDIQSTVT